MDLCNVSQVQQAFFNIESLLLFSNGIILPCCGEKTRQRVISSVDALQSSSSSTKSTLQHSFLKVGSFVNRVNFSLNSGTAPTIVEGAKQTLNLHKTIATQSYDMITATWPNFGGFRP